LRLEKGIEILQLRSKRARAGFVCSYLINPFALKIALGSAFPTNALILFSGERSIDLEKSIEARKFLDSSSIPLLGHSFHSKIYLFEHSEEGKTWLDLIVASFNATSAGMSQNLEFWTEAKAELNLEKFDAKNIAEMVLDPRIAVSSIDWNELCHEQDRQLVVAPALEVLWRLASNGVGLAPGKPKCISDVILATNQYTNYDSILVHTLGNNSLSRALDIMMQDAICLGEEVKIRIISPYHNTEGLRYLHRRILDTVGNRDVRVSVEILTVFPPDFSEKFADPKKQPFASLEEIANLSEVDERIKFSLRLWKKETNLHATDTEKEIDVHLQNVFLHGKAIAVRSENMCQFLLGSPNITSAAIGKGPGLNFETAIWERRDEICLDLWGAMETLFEAGSRIAAEDYKVLRTWSTLFSSGQYRPQLSIVGPRDAIGQYIDFYLRNGEESRQLVAYQEVPLYFDEADKTKLVVVFKESGPKIKEDAQVFFTPSDLEKTKQMTAKFSSARELCLDLPVDKSKADTISIRVDVESNLIEERKLTIREHGDRIDIVSPSIPLLDEVDEEAFLIFETEKGVQEVKCESDSGSIYAVNKSGKVTSSNALLRLYSRSTANFSSFGYFKIRCRKREPRFEAKLTAIESFPVSVCFKEAANPLAARIIPESVHVSFLTKHHAQIPVDIVATRRISYYPYSQSYIMSMPKSAQNDEMRLEIKFEDEHEGYYDRVLPLQKMGFTQSDSKGNRLYIPKEMGRSLTWVSHQAVEKLTPVSEQGEYNIFNIRSLPFFCDREDDDILIIHDFLSEFRSLLMQEGLSWLPDRACILCDAPITGKLSLVNIPKDLGKMCHNIVLCWWIRRWRTGRGTDKKHSFGENAVFEFLPTELEEIRKSFDMCPNPFEGHLDIELHYEMSRGYDLQGQMETIRISSSQIFLERIKDKIWSMLSHREKLVHDLMSLFHSFFDRKIPFEVFQRAARGDESGINALIYKYGYSPLVSPLGFPQFDIKPEDCTRLVEQASELILESLFVTFSTEEKLPKIPKDTLFRYLNERVKHLVRSVLVSIDTQSKTRIIPSALLEKIDGKWKSTG